MMNLQIRCKLHILFKLCSHLSHSLVKSCKLERVCGILHGLKYLKSILFR